MEDTDKHLPPLLNIHLTQSLLATPTQFDLLSPLLDNRSSCLYGMDTGYNKILKRRSSFSDLPVRRANTSTKDLDLLPNLKRPRNNNAFTPYLNDQSVNLQPALRREASPNPTTIPVSVPTIPADPPPPRPERRDKPCEDHTFRRGNPIGHGSYGIVYRAKCETCKNVLPLHNTCVTLILTRAYGMDRITF